MVARHPLLQAQRRPQALLELLGVDRLRRDGSDAGFSRQLGVLAQAGEQHDPGCQGWVSEDRIPELQPVHLRHRAVDEGHGDGPSLVGRRPQGCQGGGAGFRSHDLQPPAGQVVGQHAALRRVVVDD